MSITGTVYEIKGEKTFEWEIKDFLQLKAELDKKYKSPEFSFYGVSWVINIYPYGEKRDESVGYIGLYILPMSLPKPVKMNVSFNFKTADKKADLEETYTHLFDEEKTGNGYPKFISRSDLIERKSELLPSDTLTIICTLKNSERNVTTKKALLHASAQTEEMADRQKESAGVLELQQQLLEISLNGDNSDIVLKVEDQEFKSHRCILAARSPVFSAMMKNEMKESVTGFVEIKDIDAKTFSDFFVYLYTGSTDDLKSENITQLYTVADKYQVEMLKESCLNHMLENISIENFCDIFTLSVQHNEEKLKETCIKFFGKHILNIIQTCKWQSFLIENPIICNELHIKLLKLKYVIPSGRVKVL